MSEGQYFSNRLLIFLPVPIGTVDFVTIIDLSFLLSSPARFLQTSKTYLRSASPSPLLDVGVPTAIKIIFDPLTFFKLLLNDKYFDLTFF